MIPSSYRTSSVDGSHGIAAKVAEKILMLFEHGYLDALSRQEKAEHYAGWSATHNTTRRLYRLIRHNDWPLLKWEWNLCIRATRLASSSALRSFVLRVD